MGFSHSFTKNKKKPLVGAQLSDSLYASRDLTRCRSTSYTKKESRETIITTKITSIFLKS